MPELDRITRNPEIMGGKPCLRGMRVTAEDIRQALANAAWRVEEIELPLPAA